MRFTVFIVFFFSLAASAQEKQVDKLLLTKDSLSRYPNYITQHWKFSEDDDSLMASASFNDNQWEETKTSLLLSDTAKRVFKGIGWFRLHFIADTSVTGKPLAITMKHYGASEIYIDGKLIKSFGKISGADSSEYYNPQELPFIFIVPAPGEHVLAVRYANFNAQKNFKIYRETLAGFRLMIAESDSMIRMKNLRSTVFTFALLLLTGIFLALCLVHIFLYFYYREDRSNLFFSIFMFCLTLLFMLGFITYASTSPSFEMNTALFVNPVLIIASISMAGFINALFEKKKWRFRVIILLGVIALILRIMNIKEFNLMTVVLIISVSFDSVFTVIFAIIRHVKGARIIGTGILFFTLFILSIYAVAIISGGNVDIDDSTVGGRILILFLVLAILSIPISMSLYQAWRFAGISKDLSLQFAQVKVLSKKTLEQEQEKQLLLKNRKEELEKEVQQRTTELLEEKKKSDDLLLNILPAEIADEIKQQGRSLAKTFSMVTVMFTDFKDFTEVSEKVSAELLVAEIDYCFSAFDNIIQKYRIEKIKTVGDAYMCAGGLPVLTFTHAEDIVNAAIEIKRFMEERKNEKEKKAETPFEIRIGIHTGPVVAGIVGVKKFAYDIWGDTVNLAARMEEQSETGKINISGATYQLVKDKFTCTHRGKIEAKNKGMVDMYFVEV